MQSNQISNNMNYLDLDEVENPQVITSDPVVEPKVDLPKDIDTPQAPPTDNPEDPDNSGDKPDDTPDEEEDPLSAAVNELATQNIFTEYPEGFEGKEEYTKEDFVSLFMHNINLRKQDAQNELLQNLTPTTLSLVEYEIRGGSDVKEFMQSMIYQQDIKGLNVEDASDQEKIIREFYADKHSKVELDEIIQELKDLGKLESRAKHVKPQLDTKAETIAQTKLDEQKRLQDFELAAKKQLQDKVSTVLKKGNIENIPITQDQAVFLAQAILNDEVMVRIKGKDTKVSASEALVLHHKYGKDGNLERLMKSLLYLQFPEHVDNHVGKKEATKVTKKFISENKFSNSAKQGLITDRFIDTKKSKTSYLD